jgi:hypothetical protein
VLNKQKDLSGQWLKKKIKFGIEKKSIIKADLPRFCDSWALSDGYDESGQTDEEGKQN